MPESVHIGRPLKFTPECRKSILQDISDAIPYKLAAEANGIREETLYAWINKGWEDESNGIESDYVAFSKAIKQIERDRIKKHAGKISENVDRWQADAWMLERRWYKYFGANVHLQELEERMRKVEDKSKESANDEQETTKA